jgi:hypothetical protein
MTIRKDSLVAQTADKGFHHFVKHFEPLEEVSATLTVEQGLQGEYGGRLPQD